MLRYLLLLLPVVDTLLNGTIGNCDLSTPPTSWLTTSAIGILDWATAGVNPDGPNFCLQGNKTEEYVQVAYHINLSSSAERKEHTLSAENPNNACVNKDTRIRYCIPFCGEDLQEPVINAALQSGQTWVVADLIEKEVNDPNWAITVMAVDYNNPITHLNISSFLDPTVWCSVYIGIHPKLGFPYLFEIQLGNVIPQ